MSTSSAVRPKCRSCGLPIEDQSWLVWNGHEYHNDHLPNREPPIDPNPALVKALTRALRIVSDRAAGGRMLTTQKEATETFHEGRAALAAATEGRITSGADQPGTAAIVPNQQDDGSKG